MNTDIIQPARIDELCAARAKTLAQAEKAIALYGEMRSATDAIHELARDCLFQTTDRFWLNNLRPTEYLFRDIDPDEALKTITHELDRAMWEKLLEVTQMRAHMDKTAYVDFVRELIDEPPVFNEENARATFEQLIADKDLIFMRGLARCFSDLDRRFKSHDGFKIGARMILTNAFWTHLSDHLNPDMRDTFLDIERVLRQLDDSGRASLTSIVDTIQKARKSQDPHQTFVEGTYFKARCFKNGNIHLYFTDDALLRKVNKVLHAYYGEVLGDAVPKSAADEDIRRRGSAVIKGLAFYPTPPHVISAMMRELRPYKDWRVLEPSAGTGNIVMALAERVAHIDAIEVDPERVAKLRGLDADNLRVKHANFLATTPVALYDAVYMNPPFVGTHWIDHVTHAYEFLKAGGELVTVLPATAQTGESKRHIAFRAWAKLRHSGWRNYLRFVDLPQESFADAGTRINTVLLTLRKRGE